MTQYRVKAARASGLFRSIIGGQSLEHLGVESVGVLHPTHFQCEEVTTNLAIALDCLLHPGKP